MSAADSSPRILLVEDDRLLLRMLAETLQDVGLSTTTTDRAAEAAAYLEASNGVELLVTDINMPGMSGLELLNLAQARHTHVKRMVISGRPDLCDGLLPPATAFLAKPFTARQFLGRVVEVLGGSR